MAGLMVAAPGKTSYTFPEEEFLLPVNVTASEYSAELVAVTPGLFFIIGGDSSVEHANAKVNTIAMST
jgi:hypothetical protein